MATTNSYLNSDASGGCSRQRVLSMIAVIALHLSVLALFMSVSHLPHGAAAETAQPLIFLPTVILPTHQAAASDLSRRNSDKAISITLPSVDFPTLPSMASDSQGRSASDGVGEGVDWAAEARRELQAHEIRQNAPPDENHMAGRSPEESWWPRAAHQQGDQYKTTTGDWVVWINANCYQVATAMPRGVGPGPVIPPTYCSANSHSPAYETIGGGSVGVSSQH